MKTARTLCIFLLLALLHAATLLHAAPEGPLCTIPAWKNFPENNTVNAVVTDIPTLPGVVVTAELSKPENIPNPFRIIEVNTVIQLIATEVLDYEKVTSYTLQFTCTEPNSRPESKTMSVLLTDENDNPPVFSQSTYDITVDEFSPVGASVARITADDADLVSQLFYTLSGSSDFELQAPTQPNILIRTLLDYDKIKHVQLILTVQDTPFSPPDITPSHSATATIMVTIVDVDNRPPWFQPCNRFQVGGVAICQNSGYRGRVNLNELELGPLPLDPGPLHAIDGDIGINSGITYAILSGNEDGLFSINGNTGNITMTREADVVGLISLTVLASQTTDMSQFATTSVTFSVQVKSLHPPRFEHAQYEGVISSVGSMVMDLKNKDEPLRIIARDQDYVATEGINPDVTYAVAGSSDFSIINGFLFMTRDLPDGTLPLQVEAEDTSNSEKATAQLTVKVTSGLTTTSLPPSTTDITTSNSETTQDAQSTTKASTTGSSMSSTPSDSTTGSGVSTEGSMSTSNPSGTTGDLVPSANTAQPHTGVPPGGYGTEDMAALGATLGVLLFVCMVVIIVLAVQIRNGKAAWRKIYETSVFRNSLGQGSAGQKEAIQYSNENFQHDDDEDGGSSSGVPSGFQTGGRAMPLPETLQESSSPQPDDEKEVKPILTREKRTEDGYKAVWFKEDIDPNAKEEVVIIPDSREEEDEDGEEDDDRPMKIPKVGFADTEDMDSGLGVRMEEPEDDSEEEGMTTSEL